MNLSAAVSGGCIPPGSILLSRKFLTERVLMMKKLAACLLALALALSLAGCGGDYVLLHEGSSAYTELDPDARLKFAESGLPDSMLSMLGEDDIRFLSADCQISSRTCYYSLEGGEAREISYAEYTRPSGSRLALSLAALRSGRDFRVYFYAVMPELPGERGEQRLYISDDVLSCFSQVSLDSYSVVYTHTETSAGGEVSHAFYEASPDNMKADGLGFSFSQPEDENAQNLRALFSARLRAEPGTAHGLRLDAACVVNGTELPLSLDINYSTYEVTQ